VYNVFSIDDHIIEHADVWTSRVPAKYRDRAPHIVDVDGQEMWAYEDVRESMLGVMAVAGRPRDEWGTGQLRFSDMIPGCYDPVARARDMYSNGVVASACFPTLPGFGGRKFAEFKDKDLALECVRAYNDFILDEWCAAAPELFVPMTITPVWDVDLTVAEVERCLAKGTKALSFVEDPAKMGVPGFWSDYWGPLMALCQESGLPLCMHLGSGGHQHVDKGDGGGEVRFGSGMASAPIVELAIATSVFSAVCTVNLACSPIARKFPDVKYVWSESGIGWIPAAFERADRQWERHRLWTDLEPTLPSEVMKRSFWFGTIDEPIGMRFRDAWDPESKRVLFETDYPHADTNWPHIQEALEPIFEGVSEEHRERILFRNAEELFGWKITVPAGAPLPSEPAGI
jgi:predicted TIM-barrel fold metal-dependent hydrolase